MNYLAHGLSALDQPWRLVGTALPDLARMVTRRRRLRPEDLAVLSRGPETELAEGVRQHFEDDRRFHASERFGRLQSRLTLDLRERFGDLQGFRASVVGHVLVEMLLDASLASRDSTLLDRYYNGLAQVARSDLEAAVARIRDRGMAQEVGAVFERFREARFLEDYSRDAGIRRRMNGLLTRVRVTPCPAELEDALPLYRAWIDQQCEVLLQETRG